MAARIIDGKQVAASVKDEVAAAVKGLDSAPGLATVLVGGIPALVSTPVPAFPEEAR